jgi:hypothetical protein
MTDLDRQLRELVEKACSHPPGSAIRQKALTQIIAITRPKLWREGKLDYYADALQKTWLFFCRNICESTTGEMYDPDRASIITWLNNYLKRRLQDFEIEGHKAKHDFIPSQQQGADGATIDIIEQQPAPADIPPILAEVTRWVEIDADGSLRATHLKGYPQVNCQLLILRRLPPETSWEKLSQELDISISSLSTFYQRKCLPKLRNFGQSEGYV